MTIDDERLFITIDAIKTMGISSSIVMGEPQARWLVYFMENPSING
jgi:hypothetical protein